MCWNGCVYIELWRSNSQLGHSMPHFTHHRPHQTHNTRTYYPPTVYAKWCGKDQILAVQCCDCSTSQSMYVRANTAIIPSHPPCQVATTAVLALTLKHCVIQQCCINTVNTGYRRHQSVPFVASIPYPHELPWQPPQTCTYAVTGNNPFIMEVNN